ncbi:TPA: ATP-binding domain-containing protein [Vibrio cholerae]|uniref:3'-5' exonuclease n=1 Tax=Vibrio cholerae TaxID=666 RepID=UPI001C30BA15|nr:3'-5' exonuclease [Vibrio cholerae]HEJ2473174.1 ATP-binding domain-containing protein [Vibrio cholerae]HEK4036058.1 ATP-binding domain-containing protein [Vibrio cholerae]
MDSIAVLARYGIEKDELAWVRSALTDANIPCRFTLDKEQSFPIHRCRELLSYLRWLQKQGYQLMTAQQLTEPLPPIEQANRWEKLLYELIYQWQDSQGEQALSAHHFMMFLQEYLNEQRRQIRFGKGVLLSTIHGVKGEEFHHVIVLDGGWQQSFGSSQDLHEEERRLFYVALTRARERLVVMAREDQKHPHLSLIETICFKEAKQASRPQHKRHFTVMSMRDLVLSYAGWCDPQHDIHHKLSQVKVGDSVRVDFDKQQRLHLFHENYPIARLSKKGESVWQYQYQTIRTAKVLAMIERHKAQEETYQDRLRSEHWEIPIIELELYPESQIETESQNKNTLIIDI